MKLAVVAGNRTLPLFFCRQVRKTIPGLQLTAIAFKRETDPAIRNCVDRLHWVDPGSLHELLDIFKKDTFDQAVMVGQINPRRIFENPRKWDTELKALYASVRDFRPHTVFRHIIDTIESSGTRFVNYDTFLAADLAGEGLQNSLTADFEALRIKPLLPLIKNIVNLDVGQTVVVKNKTIVAVEAVEGTDQTILRGARLAGKACVVAKCARDNHDPRFDIPVVGPRTIAIMRRVKAAALVVEAGKVLFIDKARTAEKAAQMNIPIWGVRFV